MDHGDERRRAVITSPPSLAADLPQSIGIATATGFSHPPRQFLPAELTRQCQCYHWCLERCRRCVFLKCRLEGRTVCAFFFSCSLFSNSRKSHTWKSHLAKIIHITFCAARPALYQQCWGISINKIPRSLPGAPSSCISAKGCLHELCGYTHDLAQRSAQSDLWETMEALSISRGRRAFACANFFFSPRFLLNIVYLRFVHRSGTKPLPLPRKSARGFLTSLCNAHVYNICLVLSSIHGSLVLRPSQP